ncbi:MAG: transporter, partial [Candidatus Marinimicrobia bacterium]|nr:transporter [Candidatus Neomarinimicrobiota bacterium]
GIIKGVDVRLITSTFTKSMDRFKPDGTKFTDTNNGLGDFKLVGRYGIFNQKTGPANVIVGAGVTIPVGTTDAVDSNGNLLPGGMQLGSGSWNPMFEFGAHKVSKQHWNSVHFLYVMSMKGELGPHEFTRSQVLKYNYAYNYALNNKFDVGAELNGEIKSMGVLNGVDLATSGGHAIYFAPEVHYKFSKKAYMGICAPIPVYENLNGPQLGGGLMIVANVVVKF